MFTGAYQVQDFQKVEIKCQRILEAFNVPNKSLKQKLSQFFLTEEMMFIQNSKFPLDSKKNSLVICIENKKNLLQLIQQNILLFFQDVFYSITLDLQQIDQNFVVNDTSFINFAKKIYANSYIQKIQQNSLCFRTPYQSLNIDRQSIKLNNIQDENEPSFLERMFIELNGFLVDSYAKYEKKQEIYVSVEHSTCKNNPKFQSKSKAGSNNSLDNIFSKTEKYIEINNNMDLNIYIDKNNILEVKNEGRISKIRTQYSNNYLIQVLKNSLNLEYLLFETSDLENSKIILEEFIIMPQFSNSIKKIVLQPINKNTRNYLEQNKVEIDISNNNNAHKSQIDLNIYILDIGKQQFEFTTKQFFQIMNLIKTRNHSCNLNNLIINTNLQTYKKMSQYFLFKNFRKYQKQSKYIKFNVFVYSQSQKQKQQQQKQKSLIFKQYFDRDSIGVKDAINFEEKQQQLSILADKNQFDLTISENILNFEEIIVKLFQTYKLQVIGINEINGKNHLQQYHNHKFAKEQQEQDLVELITKLQNENPTHKFIIETIPQEEFQQQQLL